MTLGPIDDPVDVVVTETLTHAVQRQARKIERLLKLIEEAAEKAENGADLEFADRLRRELGDWGL